MQKPHTDQLDYGIYIDPQKAIIISIDEFNLAQADRVRIELNFDNDEAQLIKNPSIEQRASNVLEMHEFFQKVIVHIEKPHRVILFGPSEEKYELHKELQKQTSFTTMSLALFVSESMEEVAAVQQYTDHYFSIHSSF